MGPPVIACGRPLYFIWMIDIDETDSRKGCPYKLIMSEMCVFQSIGEADTIITHYELRINPGAPLVPKKVLTKIK